MEILIWAFLGGIVGALLMDITETYAARAGVTSGVNIALVGRWFLGLIQGKFSHANILNSAPQPNEVKIGWAFHFLIGGGGVALIYPIFFQITGIAVPGNYLICGVVFGLATSLFPWFILLPSFGCGLFGRPGPQGSNALVESTLSHIHYGFGVGAVIEMGLRV